MKAEKAVMFRTLITCGNQECPQYANGDCTDPVKGFGCRYGLVRHSVVQREEDVEPDVICKKTTWCSEALHVADRDKKRYPFVVCGKGLEGKCEYAEVYKPDGSIAVWAI